MSGESHRSVRLNPLGLFGAGPVLSADNNGAHSSLHVNPLGLLGVGSVVSHQTPEEETRYHFHPGGLIGIGPILEENKMNPPNVPVSSVLRSALAKEGWWKLAQAVKAERGLPTLSEPTLTTAVEALAMKIAADRANNRAIRQGIEALKRVRGER